MSALFRRIAVLIATDDVRISEHGYDELAEDHLVVDEVLAGVSEAQVIEEYPDYPKGAALLLLQINAAGEPIHAVWGIPRGHSRPAVLVTAYRPDPALWDSSFTKRIQS